MARSVPPESGVDRRTMLVRQQQMLWGALQACSDQRALASLSKELRAVTAEIDAMPRPEKRTVTDDLKARRAARFKDAERSARAAGESV